MKQALLLIDVQNDYFPGGRYPLDHPEDTLPVIARLLACFRARRLPVYFIQHLCPAGAPFFEAGTAGAALHPALAPRPDEAVIRKTAPNSFYRTTLAAQLEKDGVDALVAGGMMTHMCVDTTVRAARSRGLPVTLITDACADTALTWQAVRLPADIVQAVHFAALADGFADVMESEEFFTKTAACPPAAG